jgi:hypothetical protein
MKSSLVDLNTMTHHTDHDLIADHKWHHCFSWMTLLICQMVSSSCSPPSIFKHTTPEHKFPSPDIIISIKSSVPLQDILNTEYQLYLWTLILFFSLFLSSLVSLPSVVNLEDSSQLQEILVSVSVSTYTFSPPSLTFGRKIPRTRYWNSLSASF